MSGSAFQAIHIPDRVWQESTDILRRRDVGALFRLARRHAGASQNRISAATGIPQSRVNALINDTGGPITALEVFERVADGLNMPDHARTALGLAPASSLAQEHGPWRTEDVRNREAFQLPSVQAEGASGDDAGTPSGNDVLSTAATLGPELWQVHDALAGGPPSAAALDDIDIGVTWLHAHYADLSPHVLLPQLSMQTRLLAQTLAGPQRISHRTRLCAALGELAGLRGWLMFDLGDLAASSAWFAVAHDAAAEAEDADLAGWLFGAASLRPSYAGDHRSALTMVEHGLAAVSPLRGGYTKAWLHALAARSHAALGSAEDFHRAWDRVDLEPASGRPRHGMDLVSGSLDTGYYAGCALLGLRQSKPARDALTASLSTLPASRVKARTVLSLAVAASHAQDGDADQAARLAIKALSLPADQCIDPILQRARDVRAELVRLGARREVRSLDDRLALAADQRALPAGTSG